MPNLKHTLENWLRKTIAGRFSKVRDFEQAKFMDELPRLVAAEADSRSLDPETRHQLLYYIQRRLLPDFVIADHGRVILDNLEFREYFTRFSNDNWTSFERKWNLKELLRLTRQLPGDFAECGVFRGGSAALMCEAAAQQGKHVHLFDSFAGLSKPDAAESSHWTEGDLAVSEADVRHNLAAYANFTTYPGWIPQRFADAADKTFSLVHVDVDLEQPTRDSIEFFFPRMPAGGILLLDDHGSAMCPGARQAALDYFSGRAEPVLDLATGQGLVIKGSGRAADP